MFWPPDFILPMSRMNDDTAGRRRPGRLRAPPRPWSTRHVLDAARLSRSSNKATWCDWPAPLAIALARARTRTLAHSHCHFNFCLRGTVVHPWGHDQSSYQKHLSSDFFPFCITFHTLLSYYFFLFFSHYLSSDPVTSDLVNLKRN